MRTLRFAAPVVLAVVAVTLLLPGRAGGTAEFVVTYGTSMQPMFQPGDLAVLRPATDYAVGDVAAYQSPDLERIVLHRIVEQQGDTFIFQGDNNDFRDSERIAAADLIGRLVLRAPKGGLAVAWLSQPSHGVPVAVAASGLPALWMRRKSLIHRHIPIRLEVNR